MEKNLEDLGVVSEQKKHILITFNVLSLSVMAYFLQPQGL